MVCGSKPLAMRNGAAVPCEGKNRTAETQKAQSKRRRKNPSGLCALRVSVLKVFMAFR
jgi:hypothetical protein